MTDDTTVELQALIDRMRQGDAPARREFLARAHGRLRRLAGKILSTSFPALRATHDLDSVVDETWLRLVQAVEKADPPTVADFFRLAAHKVRQVLLDLVERSQRWGREVAAPEGLSDRMEQTHDPARLALWTELHRHVADLPEQERAVFEMHFYLDLPQSEIARALDLHPRKVSYLWVAATERLSRVLPAAADFR